MTGILFSSSMASFWREPCPFSCLQSWYWFQSVHSWIQLPSPAKSSPGFPCVCPAATSTMPALTACKPVIIHKIQYYFFVFCTISLVICIISKAVLICQLVSASFPLFPFRWWAKWGLIERIVTLFIVTLPYMLTASLCNIRPFKLSQLFEIHWKMKSMHRSEKLLKLIQLGLLPEAWIWKTVFFTGICFSFCLLSIWSYCYKKKEPDFLSSVYENRLFIMSNLCTFDHDHGMSLGLFFWVMWSLNAFDYEMKMFAVNRINSAFDVKKKKKV